MKRIILVLILTCSGCVERSPTQLSNAVISCEFGEAEVLEPGGFVRDSAGGGRFCVESSNGGTYVLIPFLSGARDTLSHVAVNVYGGGLAVAPTALEPPTPSTVAARHPSSDAARLLVASDAWHEAFHERNAAELPILGGDGPTEWGDGSDGDRWAPAAVPRVPVPGDSIEFNAAASCDRTDIRTARVAAVTERAIVVYDTSNPPADPFTQADFETFGRQFDEVVYPTITKNFGTATDLDGNERVILFFTRAVNEIPVPGGGAGLAIGFFFRGDVFPREGIPARTAPCPGSNEAEILFLAVPDPDGEVRGVPVNRSTLRQVMTGTIAHELQHLVNTSRRLHIVGAPVLEETWLNEALSHVAEELMFYAVTGMRPGANIDTTDIYTGGAARTEAFNTFMYGNLGRFDRFIQSPHDWSPMGSDGHETRGAAWSFLRYVADRDPRDDAELFRALVDGPAAGLENLAAALDQDPLHLMEDWSVSIVADDLESAPAIYQQPSWDLPGLITALRLVDRRYPLRVLPVESGGGFSVELRVGSAAYPIFAAEPGQRAMVEIQPEGETDGRRLRTILLRVR